MRKAAHLMPRRRRKEEEGEVGGGEESAIPTAAKLFMRPLSKKFKKQKENITASLIFLFLFPPLCILPSLHLCAFSLAKKAARRRLPASPDSFLCSLGWTAKWIQSCWSFFFFPHINYKSKKKKKYKTGFIQMEKFQSFNLY